MTLSRAARRILKRANGDVRRAIDLAKTQALTGGSTAESQAVASELLAYLEVQSRD
jgi:hypothetical protein